MKVVLTLTLPDELPDEGLFHFVEAVRKIAHSVGGNLTQVHDSDETPEEPAGIGTWRGPTAKQFTVKMDGGGFLDTPERE